MPRKKMSPSASEREEPLNRHRRHFGRRIAELRAAKGLSLRELAVAADLNHQTIAFIEAGGHEPTLHTAAKLAAALGADLNDLAGPIPAAVKLAVSARPPAAE